MAVIANVTSFTGTAGDEFTIANSGWTPSTTAPFGSGASVVDGGTTSIGIRFGSTGSANKGYLRNETPGSANQIVRVTLTGEGTMANGNTTGPVARVSSNNFVCALYAPDNGGTVWLRKSISGTLSVVQTVTGVGSILGVSRDLELDVSGSSPSITAVVKFNGSTVITETLTEAALNGVGSVGLWFRPLGGGNENNGDRITAFYAEDDTGGGGGSSIAAIFNHYRKLRA